MTIIKTYLIDQERRALLGLAHLALVLYWEFGHDKFRRIIDLDDKRFKDYGVYYDERNLLTLDQIKNSLKG